MNRLKHITHKGFSLVELLLVVAIFMIMTTVVVFNQNRFSSDISISNIAYQIALQIRQAQVYGTLVRDSGGIEGVPTDFDLGYGVNFFLDGEAISFSIFADTDIGGSNPNGVLGNGYYTSNDVRISTFNLSEGNTITNVCVYGTNVYCMRPSGGAVGVVDQVDLVFRRPDPDALITANSDGSFSGATYTEIILTSALRDKQKKITVRNTGQISVTNIE